MKLFTIGEIFKLGLLLNSSGDPYKSKAEISRIVRMQEYQEKNTPFGMSKCLTEDQINKLNNKWKNL